MAVSAVIRHRKVIFQNIKLFKYINSRNITAIIKDNKMSTWQTEKLRYINMDINNKRLEYKCGENYEEVSKIPTWAEYVSSNDGNLKNKIPILPENTIDASKNVALASKISMFLGDITRLEVDAIVNAANATLGGGGGVDGAIHKAAGDDLFNENMTLGGCSVGEAKITGGYKLPAKYVIATVGPRGELPIDLKNCYQNALNLMLEKELRTIAFPCISTGLYGYPLIPAAHIAAMEVRRCLEINSHKIDRVIFCLFADTDVDVYQGILQSYFPILID